MHVGELLPRVLLAVASIVAGVPGEVAAATRTAEGHAAIIDGAKGLAMTALDILFDAALRELGARVTEHEIRIELSADVLFDFDRAELRPDALESLRKLAAVVAAYPGRPVRIV